MTLPWSDESNLLLLKLVAVYTGPRGGIDWDKVGDHFPARTAKACENQHYRLGKNQVDTISTDDFDGEDPPSHHALFLVMRDNPKTLTQLANLFDRSPSVIRRKVDEMEVAGYNVVISKDHFAVQTSTRPVKRPPPISIAELQGKEFCIGVCSDWHAGSKHAQPTSMNQFIHYAYEDYGVRHMMVPGDPSDGVYVYRGHLNNLIPQVRPLRRSMAWMTAEAEVQLMDVYAPKIDGLTYYMMGGNHDYKTLVMSGRDPIRMICDRRDDMVYGGYDSWGIPLTPKAHVRLWHPSGGVAYARSYKLQKGIENLAFEALKEAMREEMQPYVSMLIAGHYHLTNHTPEPPIHGILAGCWQGQTDYLKRKGLVPHIAGIILQMKADDKGRIYEVGHRVVDFVEIKEDYKAWPVPEIEDPDLDPEDVGVMFSITGEEPVVESDDNQQQTD